MSPLSRNELSIILGPEVVALLHTERRVTVRGYRRRVCARRIIPCQSASAGEKPWVRAIETLGAALPSVIGRKMDVSVILSNHFTQYVLVPWLDQLSDEEELAFAQHCFKEMCGNAADSLTVRISPGRPGVASLASGVDMSLLQDLGGLMGKLSVDVKSIQPHLMLAYNSCRASLEDRSAWLALLEPNSLCLAVLQKGQFAWIRKLRIGDDWREELPAILSREAYLASPEVAMDEVLLWAPHLVDEDIPTGWRWKIRHLKPGMTRR